MRQESRKRCFDTVGEISDAWSDSGSDTYNHQRGTVICIQGGGTTSQNAHGSGWNQDICFTLNALDVHGVAYEIHKS